MKTWTAPNLTELEIRLTSKNPGKVERMTTWGPGDWLSSTYAANDPTIPDDSGAGFAS